MKANEISFTEKVISSIKYREDQQNKCLEGVDCFSKSVTFKEQFQRNGSEGKRQKPNSRAFKNSGSQGNEEREMVGYVAENMASGARCLSVGSCPCT